MLKFSSSNVSLGHRISTYANMLKATPNGSLSSLRAYSVLSKLAVSQPNSVLRTQEINIVPVRNKMNIKLDAVEPHRVFNYDRYTGKRTSCEAVTKRFFRLRWGGWIRTIAQKKPEPGMPYRYKQHVFCNAQQSRLLDKMAGAWYMKPHYYVDDPYEPYHNREEFLYSRQKPLPPRE